MILASLVHHAEWIRTPGTLAENHAYRNSYFFKHGYDIQLKDNVVLGTDRASHRGNNVNSNATLFYLIRVGTVEMKATGISPAVRQHSMLLQQSETLNEVKASLERIETALAGNVIPRTANNNVITGVDMPAILSTIKETINETMATVQQINPPATEETNEIGTTVAEVLGPTFPRGTIDSVWYDWFHTDDLKNFNSNESTEMNRKSKAKMCIEYLVDLLNKVGVSPPNAESSRNESMAIYHQSRVLLAGSNAIVFKKPQFAGATLAFTTLYNAIPRSKKPVASSNEVIQASTSNVLASTSSNMHLNLILSFKTSFHLFTALTK
jgi:hypothetical protein